MRLQLIVRMALTFVGLPALTGLALGEDRILENQAICFRIGVRDGKVILRDLKNRLTGATTSLPLEQFTLELQDGTTIGSSACTLRSSATDRLGLELLFISDRSPGMEIRVRYRLPPGKPYLRKQIAVRQVGGTPGRLLRADLDEWRGVRRNWDSMHADRYPYGSHPIYCEDLWAGVEFVAAFSEYGKDGFVLRSRPGGTPLGREWLELHSTVAGVAVRGGVRDAFLRYIDDIRLAPPRMTWCYNSWWTLPERFDSAQLVALASQWNERLFQRHGTFFDVLTLDAGWSELQSLWEIDRHAFPDGFGPVRRLVESAGGRLGLWISPSGIYAAALSPDWARRSGLTVISKREARGAHALGISLADPAYRHKTQETLCRLIRENHIAHVKFDGLIPFEDKPHHDLLAGPDSVEPLAAHAIALMTAAKQCDPDLVTEPTFLNSESNYISPWILKYADTVWGNAGGDYPRGVGPAPDYRESCTNAREWYIFSSLNEVWLPQNALQYFDIIHCDEARGFVNHAAMAVARGRFFIPVYVNPKFLSDDDMAALAGLMRWSRANRPILCNTVVLPSRVERGEPYAYAHWLGRRGIIAVRNPSNESRSYALDLQAAGAPADLADAVCYTQYPYRHGLAAGLRATPGAKGAGIPIALSPWELLFIEVVPRSQLREPVAIGARWYRDGQGKMRISPDAAVNRVEVIRPGGAILDCPVTAAPAIMPSGKTLSHVVSPLPQSAWLPVKGKPTPSARYELDCEVSIPAGATKGSVLLLLQFPGKGHAQSTCVATVNGRETHLEQRTSAKPLGYAEGTHGFDPKSYWAGLIPYACEWTWYICPVAVGRSQIHFAGAAARPRLRLGAWVWADGDRSAREQSLDIPCPAPEMPQVTERLERQGICIQSPTL